MVAAKVAHFMRLQSHKKTGQWKCTHIGIIPLYDRVNVLRNNRIFLSTDLQRLRKEIIQYYYNVAYINRMLTQLILKSDFHLSTIMGQQTFGI